MVGFGEVWFELIPLYTIELFKVGCGLVRYGSVWFGWVRCG
jgi:hypothetical protein